jgi:hypothetical protein
MAKVPFQSGRTGSGTMALYWRLIHIPIASFAIKQSTRNAPTQMSAVARGVIVFLKPGADRSAQGPAAILFPLCITGKFRLVEEFVARSSPQEQFRVPPVGRSRSKETNNGYGRKRDRSKRNRFPDRQR